MGKLDRLISELKKLPEAEQEQWAEVLLFEMEMVRRSDAAPVDGLDRLAAEALAEHRAGLTVPLDELEWNRLIAEADAPEGAARSNSTKK